MLAIDSRLLMYNGKYKSGHQLRVGDTFVSGQGQHYTVIAMEKFIAPCLTLRTQTWYASTHVIDSDEILDSKYIWRRPSSLTHVADVPMKTIVRPDKNKPVHKMSNNMEIGIFLGRFLAAGGFNEDDDTPYIMTGKDKNNEIEIYQNAYPHSKYTSTSASNLIYLDRSLQSMLSELLTNPELLILENSDKTILLIAIRKGLIAALRENLYMNLEPRIIEIIYLIDHLLSKHKHDKQYHVTLTSDKVVAKQCLYLDTDSKDDECITFVVNNMMMRRKSP